MKEIKRRITVGWNGWRKATGVLCDRNKPVTVKGRVYRTCIRPATLHEIETVSMTKAQEGKDGSGRNENAKILNGIETSK